MSMYPHVVIMRTFHFHANNALSQQLVFRMVHGVPHKEGLP